MTDEIDPARHGDDDAGVGRLTLDIEAVQHGHAAVILPGSRSRGTCAIGRLDLRLYRRRGVAAPR